MIVVRVGDDFSRRRAVTQQLSFEMSSVEAYLAAASASSLSAIELAGLRAIACICLILSDLSTTIVTVLASLTAFRCLGQS